MIAQLSSPRATKLVKRQATDVDTAIDLTEDSNSAPPCRLRLDLNHQKSRDKTSPRQLALEWIGREQPSEGESFMLVLAQSTKKFALSWMVRAHSQILKLDQYRGVHVLASCI